MSLFEFALEDLIDEEQARELIQPFRKDCVEVWKLSWERWGNWNEDDRRRLCETPTARPSVLNAFAQSFAKDLFNGMEGKGIESCDAIPGVFAFYIHQKALIRFNGLGSDFTVRINGASKLKRAYLNQEPLPKLLNSATRLTVGYTLDPLKTAMDSVHLSLQVGPDLVYHFPIEGAGTIALPSPAKSPSPYPPTAGKKGKMSP
jgi:hypothetical protein